MLVSELETPVPVVDLDILEQNLLKMQAYCDLHGLRLRPHIKTHKCPEIAHMQVDRGAVGITCQKLSEAEVMADAGLSDIHLSYPIVGVRKPERLANLARRVRVSVSVDSQLGLQVAEEAATAASQPITVWVDFDSGAGRTGVCTVAEALNLAQMACSSGRLLFGGLITYPLSPASQEFFEDAKGSFDLKAIEIPGFSGAGTPSAWSAHEISGLTEVRHGTYVFHDRATVGVGAATMDECAVHVLATVVSRPSKDRAILDAGSKTLSSDRVPESIGSGFGLIREYPDSVVERLYEEHALVSVPGTCTGLQIGERVRILPNHVCVVVNLHDELIAARDDKVVKRLTIACRGKTL
ncbi:MAG: alanine racemase [Fimbriimonas sp.]|nr:alanine racemase [Fimbriimonas sp.]